MINKLKQPIYTEKEWGSEIIWAITDSYICKTVEINPLRVTELIVYENKYKSIIVVSGQLSLAMGKCCDENNLEYYDCPEGWSICIEPGIMHRYGATDKSVRIIEVSSPGIEEGIVIPEQLVEVGYVRSR